MLQPGRDSDRPLDMPPLYFRLTTPEERRRHQALLQQLPNTSGLLAEAVRTEQGQGLFELVTLDWDEPGLLDKIFEAILKCHTIPEGVSVRRTRSFTGYQGQVVTLLELRNRNDSPLQPDSVQGVLDKLRGVRPGERGVLETIQQIPVTSLIPRVTDVPSIDNEASEHYTRLEFQVERISNRFTSVLLHFLARSELWLNIQVADFEQGDTGRYVFYVVDKRGRKLRDSNFVRLSLVRTLEAVNSMLIRFNVLYVRREWTHRIEQNERTVYHSRPHFEDLLSDLENIRKLAQLKGLDTRLSSLVDEGVLDSRSFYFLKKAEAFVTNNLDRSRALVETAPAPEQVDLCREYFEYRRRTVRILMPLFQRLEEMATLRPLLSDQRKLQALCHPLPRQDYALDAHYRLYIDGPIWLGEPSHAFDAFLLMARTDCYLREDTLEAIEACLEGWNAYYIAEHRAELGAKFLALIDESIRQGNTAILLRNLRSAGLLQRYLPGFEAVQGRIHVSQEHAYTVDEHSIVVIEVLLGLKLMAEVQPEPGKSAMRADYERIRDGGGLKNYARKYAMELRMLDRATPLRSNPAIRPFFRYMEEIRLNSLEYVLELNLLQHGADTCMAALAEIEKLRNQLDPLIRLYDGLSFAEQRILVLAGLLHDIKKPAVDHDILGALALRELVAEMGLRLSERELFRLEWLIRNHLRVRPLMARIGSEGESAVAAFAQETGDLDLLRSLIVFTFADRVAVHFDRNKNSHDAMVLADMLGIIQRLEQAAAS